jgi:hypothetical protein
MRTYPLEERKLIYRILHQHLREHPELMDSQFLHDLQRELHQAAQAERVDIADHGAWDVWLGNEPVGCEARVSRREVIR